MLTAADFDWHRFFWTTTVRLPSWAGFQSRQGPYASPDRKTVSDGTVRVVFAPEGRDERPLEDAEVALVRWAVLHEAEIQASFLRALLPHYRSIRPKHLAVLGDQLRMPEVRDASEFRDLIGLGTMTVHVLQTGGVPYVGLELGCTWDEERGLGCLLHGTRIVAMGGVDTAILLWIAERDAATSRT
jgi:hypothetical protein